MAIDITKVLNLKEIRYITVRSSELPSFTLNWLGLHTCPKIVQGPPSGKRRTRINSASFTILSARKCFKYSTNCSADVNCDRDDTVKGVDKPVPRCQTKTQSMFNNRHISRWKF